MRCFFLLTPLLFAPITILTAQPKIIEDAGKKGLIDRYDEFQIVPPHYESIQILENYKMAIARNGQQVEVYKLSDNKPFLKFTSEERPVHQEPNPQYALFPFLKNGLIGMINSEGQVKLPALFQKIESRQQDLLVAFANDTTGKTTLHVFDKNCNKVLETQGEDLLGSLNIKSAGTLFRIRYSDQSIQWIDAKGQPFHFPNADHVVWSDGEVMICATYLNKWPLGENFGLLSWSGDTLLPCTYKEISYLTPNMFQWRNSVKRTGLCDRKGHDISFPLETRPLSLRNGALLTAMQSGSPRRYNIYALDGKLLWNDVDIEGLAEHPLSRCGRIPDFNPQQYMIITNPRTDKKSLHHADGRQILPEAYSNFEYFSEKSPILAVRDYTYEAFRPDGSRALKGKFSKLEYTYDTEVLLARPEGQTNWGFIDLKKPDKAVFDIDLIYPLKTSKYYRARRNGSWFLYDPRGRLMNKEPLADLRDPASEAAPYQEMFSSQGHGRLIAIGRAKDQAEGAGWIGLDEKGVARRFQETPKLVRQPESHYPKPTKPAGKTSPGKQGRG